MAVVDKFANADLEAGKKAKPALSSGAERKGAVSSVEVVSGDSNNSIYRMFGNLNREMIPTQLIISHDAFGTAGACNIGLYDSDTGLAVDEDCFSVGLSLVSAAREVDGMTAVAIEDLVKRFWEHAGDTLDTKKNSYDLGIKVTNVGANGAGTITARLEYLH